MVGERIFLRKLDGGMTVLAKLQVRKNIFKKLGRRGQFVKMNIWLPKEHLGILFILQKR